MRALAIMASVLVTVAYLAFVGSLCYLVVRRAIRTLLRKG